MAREVIIALVFSCVLVVCCRADIVDDALDTVQDTYKDAKDAVAGNSTVTTVEDPEAEDPEANSEDEDRRPPFNLTSSNGVVNGQDNMVQASSGYMCRECTIEKNLDNTVLSVYDNAGNSGTVTICPEYPCQQASHTWCLVTYYRVTDYRGQGERKIERHECGSRDTRDADLRCKALYQEDDLKTIQSCETKRSSALSFSLVLPLTIALLSLFLH